MKKLILLLSITFLVFSSCKKNNPLETDEAKEVRVRQEALTANASRRDAVLGMPIHLLK